MIEHPDYRAELEANEAEVAERAKRIEREETLAWCKARDEARREAETTVTKSAPSTRRDNQAMTNEWQAYIAGEINRSEMHVIKLLAETTGEVLGELQRKFRAEAQAERENMRAEFEAAIAELKIQLLESQLAEARGLPKRSLKVVPPTDMIG